MSTNDQKQPAARFNPCSPETCIERERSTHLPEAHEQEPSDLHTRLFNTALQEYARQWIGPESIDIDDLNSWQGTLTDAHILDGLDETYRQTPHYRMGTEWLQCVLQHMRTTRERDPTEQRIPYLHALPIVDGAYETRIVSIPMLNMKRFMADIASGTFFVLLGDCSEDRREYFVYADDAGVPHFGPLFFTLGSDIPDDSWAHTYFEQVVGVSPAQP